MALLGTLIDSRTLAAINTNASASFAHGLPAAPDEVNIMQISSAASATGVPYFDILVDATNVSIYNQGPANSVALRVISKYHHSLVR
jgi:hypothetical protein